MFTRFFLFYKYHKLIAINLSKQQQQLYADPKVTQQTNFTGNRSRAEGTAIKNEKKQF